MTKCKHKCVIGGSDRCCWECDRDCNFECKEYPDNCPDKGIE